MSLTSKIRAVIAQIRAREAQHMELLYTVLKLDGGSVFPADLIVAGATQRSLMLTKGFVAMVKSRNALCAGALLRLQVDNILRLYASSLYPSSSETLMAFLEDRPLHELKAPDGKRLTDAELCKRVGAIYPWVPAVYKETCSFVHFSRPAVMSAVKGCGKAGELRLEVGADGGRCWVPEERLETVEAFDAATKAVLDLIYSWGHAKANVTRQRSTNSC